MRSGSARFGMVLATCVLALVFWSAATPAWAHGGYPRTWGPITVTWHFTAGFPEGAGQRDSVREGADQWTNTPNANFNWSEGNERANWPLNADCTASWNLGLGNNTINWKPIDGRGGILGDTVDCPASGSGDIKKFWTRFDSDDAADFHWPGHPPDDPPIQSDEVDGWALATHELGHATGFNGHITDPNLCESAGIDLHTMCLGIYVGLARQRTVEVHDVDTFKSAY
jgi:hypothetical protein